MQTPPMRLQVHGKHFHLDGKPHFLRTVTYGPFPPDCPHHPAADFPKIRAAGFDSIRVYSLPGKALLDEAAQHDLLVIPTHAWALGCDEAELERDFDVLWSREPAHLREPS